MRKRRLHLASCGASLTRLAFLLLLAAMPGVTYAQSGATVADVALMRRTVGSEMGVKAAGGVKGISDARAMVEAGATRIGASVGVKIAQEAAGQKTTGAAAAY